MENLIPSTNVEASREPGAGAKMAQREVVTRGRHGGTLVAAHANGFNIRCFLLHPASMNDRCVRQTADVFLMAATRHAGERSQAA